MAPTAAGDPSRDFAAMMALEPHGPDTWMGTGPRYPWGGLYGGQIVAQALRAADHSVDDAFRAHSVHAYFIRRGDQDEPVRYEVERVRDGRSFTTRTVTARQAVGAILSASVSFQVDEDAPEVQTATMPEVPAPSEVTEDSWSPLFRRRQLPVDDLPGRARGWLALGAELGAGVDPVLHACGLAYVSDDLPTDAALSLHPEWPGPGAAADEEPDFLVISLDHAIWFHRPIRADDWHLHAMVSHGLMSSRGLAVGHVFAVEGTHVATITQECLLRRRRGR